MHAGLPKYVPVNLKDIEAAGFQEGDEVSLETLKRIGLINPSGRERRLPLKVRITRSLLNMGLIFPDITPFFSKLVHGSTVPFMLLIRWFAYITLY